MKIAQVVCVYPPYRGGIGNTAKEYVEGLKQAGHEVQVYTPDYRRALSWGNAAFVPSLLWKLRGFDIIHLHYPFYGAAFFAAVASVLWRTPLVVTYHMKTQGGGLLGLLFWLHRLFMEPFILGDAQCLLVSSVDYARSVGLERYPVKTQPFSVDTERFVPGAQAELRQSLGISQESCVFLFVGGMDDAHYFKGVPLLLKAAARLNKDEAWDVVLVGGGNRKPVYEAQAQALGIEQHMHFVGRVAGEDLPRYYQLGNVHVLPSIDQSEAFGLVTLEAAASGLPSLVSDLPGVRTLVLKGQTGQEVEVNDIAAWTAAMEGLLHDPERRATWGRSARTVVVERYSQQVLRDELISTYERVTVGAGFAPPSKAL